MRQTFLVFFAPEETRHILKLAQFSSENYFACSRKDSLLTECKGLNTGKNTHYDNIKHDIAKDQSFLSFQSQRTVYHSHSLDDWQGGVAVHMLLLHYKKSFVLLILNRAKKAFQFIHIRMDAFNRLFCQ